MRLTILNQFYAPDVSPTAHLAASLAEHRARRGDAVTVVASGGGYVGMKSDKSCSAGRPTRRSDDRAEHAPPSAAANTPPAAVRVRRVWTPRLGKATKLRRLVDYACFYLGAAWRLATLPRQDVIVALTTPPMIAWAGLLHRLVHPRGPRPRLVLWNMDCYPEIAERAGVIRPGGVPSRLMRWTNRLLFRRLDHLVCLDAAMAELLLNAYGPEVGPEPRARASDEGPDQASGPSPEAPLRPGVSRPPTTVIPNWERASLFPADRSPPRWEPADRLGLDGRFVVLYLGNTGFGHRFETVLDAADRLRDQRVTFLFVGGGARWEALRRAAEHAGLNNVVFHGYVPKEQTPAVMAAAHCALITLREQALGVMSPSKLHANLAMGLPVIYVGPAGSNVDQAIERFGCGVSLQHGEADQLADFIRDAMARPTALTALRDKARAAFEQAYCDTRTLPRFDAVLEPLGATAQAQAHRNATRPGTTHKSGG